MYTSSDELGTRNLGFGLWKCHGVKLVEGKLNKAISILHFLFIIFDVFSKLSTPKVGVVKSLKNHQIRQKIGTK